MHTPRPYDRIEEILITEAGYEWQQLNIEQRKHYKDLATRIKRAGNHTGTAPQPFPHKRGRIYPIANRPRLNIIETDGAFQLTTDANNPPKSGIKLTRKQWQTLANTANEIAKDKTNWQS